VEKELHILILEDVATDVEMIERELQKGGIKFTSKRVETEEAFLSGLKEFVPDLILADYKLPQFDGFSALAIVKEQCPDVPFILVSGTLGEEEAVEALKAGATDYILKQKLLRLVPAVKRALREFEVRLERKIAREKLKESENLYRTIFETTGTATIIIEEDTIVSLTNLEGERITGYSKEEIEGKKSWTEVMVKDDLDKMKEYHRLRRIDPDSAPKNYEARMIDRQGNIKNVIVTASMIPGTRRSVASILDITGRKKGEKELANVRQEWEDIFQAIGHPTLILDPKHNVIAVNRAVIKATGISKEESLRKKCYEVFHNAEKPPKDCPLEKLIVSGHLETVEMEMEALGGIFFVSCTPVLDDKGNIQKVIHIATDITKRKKAEAELKESENKFKDFAEKSIVGIYLIQDRLLRYINPVAAKIFDYTVEEIIDKKCPEDLTAPEDWPVLEESLRKRISGEIKEAHYNFRGIKRNKDIIYLESHGAQTMYKGRPAVIGSLMDITERRKAEEEIQKRVKELEEFYRMAVGRETKMIALKEEIEKLKEELEKYKK